MLTNDRSGGSNLLKIGTQIQRNPTDLVQRPEDRPKNVVQNKRVRSSVAEIRVCIQKYFKICSLFSFLQYLCFLGGLHLATKIECVCL